MFYLMLLSLTQAPPARPPEGCVLEGVVTMKRAGKRVPPTDVVVYLKDGPPRARPEPVTHVIKQKNLKFLPNVLVVLLGDRVIFTNEEDDTQTHSVFSRQGADPFPGEVNERATTFSRAFNKEGAVHIQCNVHVEMNADVLVLRSAAFTRPDAEGKWRITGLERKAYTLMVWEPNGAEQTREVSACGSGPVELELTKQVPVLPLRRDGTRYRPEYPDLY